MALASWSAKRILTLWAGGLVLQALAKQRADARADRTYTVTASGDTLFPLVHVPSGRPDSATVAVLGEQTRRTARYLTVVMLGLIPSVLILVTLGWMIVRRGNPGPS